MPLPPSRQAQRAAAFPKPYRADAADPDREVFQRAELAVRAKARRLPRARVRRRRQGPPPLAQRPGVRGPLSRDRPRPGCPAGRRARCSTARSVAVGRTGAMSFQRLQNRAGRSEASLRFYVFDLLYLDGVRSARRTAHRTQGAPARGTRADRRHRGSGHVRRRAWGCSMRRRSISSKASSPRARQHLRARQARADVVEDQDRPERRVRRSPATRSAQDARTETLGSLILGIVRRAAQTPLRRPRRHRLRRGERCSDMLRRLRPLQRATSPFDEPVPRGGGSSRTGGAGVWVEPNVVAEIKYSERTGDGRLRHPGLPPRPRRQARVEVRPQRIVEAPASGRSDRAALAVLRL